MGQPATVTFAFRSTAYTPDASGNGPNGTGGFNRLTQTQIDTTLLALAAWSDVANITFVRVDDGDGYSNNATMLFSNTPPERRVLRRSPIFRATRRCRPCRVMCSSIRPCH
ncbi:MAG: hypothetical protein HZY74_12535 [Brevundimonas sp.]|nr:MAG: hypothetical protein HZY74_12535 [Brevundimonas sp.]